MKKLAITLQILGFLSLLSTLIKYTNGPYLLQGWYFSLVLVGGFSLLIFGFILRGLHKNKFNNSNQ